MTVRPSIPIWAFGAVAFAAMAVLAIWFARAAASSPNADPGGRILNQLRTASQALPGDAQVIYRNDIEPNWDSCDGRPGTFGWDNVVVQIHFQSRTGTAALVDHADRMLRGLGWTSDYKNVVNGGPQVGWSRRLENGSLAKAQLTNVAPDQGGASQDWDLFVTAPPVGPRVSGC